jgi:hypothetical protein
VMFALLVFRVEALGPIVKMNLGCERCSHEWRAPIDLNTVEVRVPANAGALARTFRLRDGVTVQGKEYRDLVLDPARWSSLNTRTRKGAVADLTIAMMHGSIRHALPDGGGDPVVVPLDSLDEMSKYDFEHVRAFIDEEHHGADLDLQSECPACDHVTRHGLDWSWDFFFRSASL